VRSEALYEQYKDALRRGHVASVRGQLEDALLAYAEAARIAPERPTPHSSAGTALLRRKRPADALLHYETALAMAPRDELALMGRAQALAALQRRGEAADAFDVLADVQAGSGHLADAVDAARRGLELAEGRERRRTLERLIARLRASQPDEPGRLALERALQVLDGSAVPAAKPPFVPGREPGHERARGTATAMAAAGASGVTPSTVPDEVGASPSVEAVGSRVGGPAPAERPMVEGAAPEPPTAEAAAAEPAPTDSGASGPGTGAVSAAESGAAVSESSGGPGLLTAIPARSHIPVGATGAEMAARAEAAVDAGVPGPAVDALLDLAAVHTRDGLVDAALDACYAAVSFDPDNVALHLTLVELYAGRGWDGLAGEKLDLLERLARLDEDEQALINIAGVRARHGGPEAVRGPV
jgi:tetratricopeptide (TPR) repeat protein